MKRKEPNDENRKLRKQNQHQNKEIVLSNSIIFV